MPTEARARARERGRGREPSDGVVQAVAASAHNGESRLRAAVMDGSEQSVGARAGVWSLATNARLHAKEAASLGTRPFTTEASPRHSRRHE